MAYLAFEWATYLYFVQCVLVAQKRGFVPSGCPEPEMLALGDSLNLGRLGLAETVHNLMNFDRQIDWLVDRQYLDTVRLDYPDFDIADLDWHLNWRNHLEGLA